MSIARLMDRQFIYNSIVGTYTLLEVSRKYWLALDEEKNNHLDFILFLQMKFTVT